MARLSVCIEMFWGDQPHPQRIQNAASLGFEAVEFWNWQNKDLDAIKAAVDDAGIRVASFCMEAAIPLVHPNAGEALVEGAKASAAAAKTLGVDRLILTTGNERKGESFEVTRHTVIRNLKALAPVLEDAGITICLEPLNPIVNHLGYWLTKMSDAADLVAEVDSPSVKILMDIYHQQITEGNIIDNIRQYIASIAHFHAAGVPGRHELSGGELDYAGIFKAIDELGYDGVVGLEFSPAGDPEEALRQAQQLAGD